jgi:predicted nucleotidyltransferase
MRLDSHTTIADVPVLRVREFMRFQEDSCWRVSTLASALKVSKGQASQVVRALLRLRYIRLDRTKNGVAWYQRSQAGSTFCLANASRPLTRSTAERKLSEFMQRVQQVNSNQKLAFRIRKVVVFGSYLTGSPRLGDIDIAVDLAPRETDRQKQTAIETARISDARSKGRRFRNILAEVYWPRDEVGLFLKSRSRAISLHTTEDAEIYGGKCKVLYEESLQTETLRLEKQLDKSIST